MYGAKLPEKNRTTHYRRLHKPYDLHCIVCSQIFDSVAPFVYIMRPRISPKNAKSNISKNLNGFHRALG